METKTTIEVKREVSMTVLIDSLPIKIDPYFTNILFKLAEEGDRDEIWKRVQRGFPNCCGKDEDHQPKPVPPGYFDEYYTAFVDAVIEGHQHYCDWKKRHRW